MEQAAGGSGSIDESAALALLGARRPKQMSGEAPDPRSTQHVAPQPTATTSQSRPLPASQPRRRTTPAPPQTESPLTSPSPQAPPPAQQAPRPTRAYSRHWP